MSTKPANRQSALVDGDTGDHDPEYEAETEPAPETESTSLVDACDGAEIQNVQREWRELYHIHHNPKRIAAETGTAEAVVRQRLSETVLHPNLDLKPESLGRFLPHEIDGVSPLGCGNPDCGEQNIVVHPCPECGFDPRGGATDA